MTAILILTLTAIIILFAGIFGVKKLLAPIGVLGLAGAIIYTLLDNDGLFREYQSMFFFDPYARVFSILIMFTTLLVFLLGPGFMKDDDKNTGDKYALILFSVCGGITMLSFTNLVMLFLGIEILSIPLYVLAASDKNDAHSTEAGMKYFLMGSFATGVLLFGMVLIYGATGSLNILDIFNQINGGSVSGHLLTVGLLMLIIGLGFKVSAAPFHFWSPDVYDGTPSLFTSFMSTVVKTAAFGAFFRLFFNSFIGITGQWTEIIAILSALTMTVANITAIYQSSFKRMMAYSSISHAGYLLIGLVSVEPQAMLAMLIYLGAYSAATIAAFTVFIQVQQETGRTDFNVFNGLGKRKPLMAFAMTLAMLSLAGIPLTGGFFGKYYLFSLSFEKYPWLLIVAIMNSAVSIYYYFRVIVAIWFKESEANAISLSSKPAYSAVLVLTCLLILAIGVYPGFLEQLLAFL